MTIENNLNNTVNSVEQKSKEIASKISDSAVGQKGKKLASKASNWTGNKVKGEAASFAKVVEADVKVQKMYEGVLWTKFINDGLVIKERADFLMRWGVLPVTLLFGLSISHDIASNTIGIKQKLESPTTIGFFDTFWTSPIQTVKTTFMGNSIWTVNDEAVNNINSSIVQVDTNEQFKSTLTSVDDYNGFVNKIVVDPIKMLSGAKGYYSCEKTTTLNKQWINPNKMAESPLCHISADKKTVYLMSYASLLGTATPMFGIFHQTEGKWNYFNTSEINSYPLSNYETISLNNIAVQLQKDFPDLVEKEVLSDKDDEEDGEESIKESIFSLYKFNNLNDLWNKVKP